MNKSKVSLVTYQIVEKIQLIIGIFILFVFGVCTIVAIADPTYGEDGFLLACIIFDAIGILLVFLAHRRKKLVKAFKVYVTRLSVDATGSIENLASVMNTSQDVVKTNLKKMINKKFFVNAYMDESSNRIVFPVSSSTIAPMANFSDSAVSQQHPQQNVQYVSVKCINCGGITNVAVGQTCECDFCGASVRGK